MARQHSHAAQPRSDSPLVVNIARLGRRPGAMFAVHETVANPARIGLDMIGIEAGAPLDLDLRVESVSEGVLVTGTMSAPITGDCSRCLTPFERQIDVHLTELFAYPDSLTQATTEEDEVGHVVADTVDLEQPIIDAVGLELPFSPVCRDDCPGLCATCGVALATAEPGHHHDQIDPRWAKLTTMLGDSDGAVSE
ncbi:hypothetical protein A5658_13890 [Mycobacterium sp. 1245111.1]|uniref:YceD family protein n=1 Tax=Mycobacterium sp. 1245111.1 TaxID=1834073 RepID=UPI0008016495|nr:DUF177 domain-containing protein [Mycobacterium sp. 1245111.1]OBK33081.1 hypothetical protein A5658_13890 [Mycobacterium sp. 1245111.1]